MYILTLIWIVVSSLYEQLNALTNNASPHLLIKSQTRHTQRATSHICKNYSDIYDTFFANKTHEMNFCNEEKQ